jgi:O-succinylbenzoic acid--CoA ligase
MERAELKKLVMATGCAEERGKFIFLRDPTRAAALEQSKIENPKSKINAGWLGVATGGTSGGVRYARHDEHTLSAAVRGFCTHFGIDHVSGLMARVRCAATGGKHVAWDWKKLEAGSPPSLKLRKASWVISLVPTQLQRLLGRAEMVTWLREFRAIFVGGGPMWPELAAAAARAELPLSPSYGMTETAAMVAALRPEEFLSGARSCGAALPHARLALDAEGVVNVEGESVFRGYWPGENAERKFVTEDIGRRDERGHWHILGRRDAVIITGGKKVMPAEVEAVLLASGEFSEVAVIGVPNAEWGEVVVAFYPACERTPSFVRAAEALPGFQRPKRFVAVADWPRNSQGKLNRAALRAADRSE